MNMVDERQAGYDALWLTKAWVAGYSGFGVVGIYTFERRSLSLLLHHKDLKLLHARRTNRLGGHIA